MTTTTTTWMKETSKGTATVTIAGYGVVGLTVGGTKSNSHVILDRLSTPRGQITHYVGSSSLAVGLTEIEADEITAIMRQLDAAHPNGPGPLHLQRPGAGAGRERPVC